MMRCALCALLAVLPTALSAAEFHRTYIVAAHTDAAKRDPLGVFIRGLSPGDAVTVVFLPPDGYTMVSSEVRDYTPLGWQPAGGIGRYRVVIPNNQALAAAHEAEFFGRLKKDPTDATSTAAGDGPATPEEYFWGVKGAVELTKAHEGLGVDALRNPPSDTAFVPASPMPPNAVRGQAVIIGGVGEEAFSGSDGSRELGLYTGYLTSNPQITTKELPPAEQKPCPQDQTDTVTFVYRGVQDGISLVLDPDSIAIDTEPSYDGVGPIRLPYVKEQWPGILQRTEAHEDHHRADAHRVATEAAAYLRTARGYGYAPTERRARSLSLIAAAEFLGSGYMMRMRDRIDQEGKAYDDATDHGFKTP